MMLYPGDFTCPVRSRDWQANMLSDPDRETLLASKKCRLDGDCSRCPMQLSLGQTKETPMASPIMKHFRYQHLSNHLPKHAQNVSRYFADLADYVDRELPDCAEKSAALRKILEGKDAAVRAALEAQA